MGIIATARQAARASLSTFNLTNPTRAQLRKFAAASVDAWNEWLAKHDAQDAAAPAAFAETKPAAFKTFVDTLPAVVLDADPEDPVA